jgi:molybdopterin synthase catalytic subunit|eukprot:g7783.t1
MEIAAGTAQRPSGETAKGSPGKNVDGVLEKNNVRVEISSSLLDILRLTNSTADPSCGAISTFIGTTRDNFGDKMVQKLEYEAYTRMALLEMLKVGEVVKSKWPDVFKIVYAHRVGTVPVMEASIVIAISSPHRKASLEAVQFSIDELKARVPIWKKEVYLPGEVDHQAEWKKNAVQARIPSGN